MAWSDARPLKRLSDARNSYVIELAKYNAMLTSPTADPKDDDEDGTALFLGTSAIQRRTAERRKSRRAGRQRAPEAGCEMSVLQCSFQPVLLVAFKTVFVGHCTSIGTTSSIGPRLLF